MQGGTHRLGPHNATLEVRTYRQGMASKAGHDLFIDVSSWEATITVPDGAGEPTIEMSADPRSLHPREGHGGVKPLSDKDRADIKKNIANKVLGEQAINFRSTAVQQDGDGRLQVSGELSLAGAVRPLSCELNLSPDGQVTGTVPVVQSDWGIKPFTGLMGALKVRDDVEVVLDARLPPG